MSQEINFVRMDENGVYRVGKTQVMFDSILAAFKKGDSAESIMQQYPAVTLAEVYGSISYYLTHREIIDPYLRRQEKVWEQWQKRSEQESSPVKERLKAIQSSDGQ